MRVALTGGTGFIGRHILQLLCDRDIRVVTLRRGGGANSRACDGRSPQSERVGDLCDTGFVREAISDCTHVVHVAGTVRGLRPADFFPGNVATWLALTESGSARPGLRMLGMSSLAASQPTLSDYAASKRLGEDTWTQSSLGHWTILRPTAVYGPGDRELAGLFRSGRLGVLPVVGSLDQRLSFLHVSDLAAAVLAWLESRDDEGSGRIYELDDGTPNGYSWDDIAGAFERTPWLRVPLSAAALGWLARSNEVCARIFGYAPMLTRGKVNELVFERWVGDNRAFTTWTGWQPKLQLADGLRSLAEAARPT